LLEGNGLAVELAWACLLLMLLLMAHKILLILRPFHVIKTFVVTHVAVVD